MNIEKSMAILGKAFADESRTKMLCALMSGKALTATELAVVADIMPSTASMHLQKLVQVELLCVCKQGRHRYFQLANPMVAELIEHMGVIAPIIYVKTGPKNIEVRTARVCYDHIAGELGVTLLFHFLDKGLLEANKRTLNMTETGELFFTRLGFDKTTYARRRPICRFCLDWSERRHHLAGTLGAWLLNYVEEQQWATQSQHSRALLFSVAGLASFEKLFFTVLSD